MNIMVNMITALASLAETVTSIENVTAQVNSAMQLISTATQESRDITDLELKQITACADLSRLSLAEALGG